MNEYIEKNALYKKIAELEELARNRYLDTPSNSPACARYMAQLDERTRFKHMIYDSPAADVAEVKHGKWNGWHGDKLVGIDDNGDDMYRHYHYNTCSECGRGNAIKSDYCPNCGAKMDLED